MKKLCLHCMKPIPLFAGRCPHCISEGQGVHGRFILLLLLIIGLVVFAKWYTAQADDFPTQAEIQAALKDDPGETVTERPDSEQSDMEKLLRKLPDHRGKPLVPEGSTAEEELIKELDKIGLRRKQ